MKMFENFYTTSMSEGKKQLKTRFDKMRREVSAAARLMSLIAAVVVLCTTVMAMAGAAAADKKTADSIAVLYNGEEKVMTNRPFISNSEVYVPLREVLNCCGVANGDIAYDNGAVTVMFHTQLPEAETVRASLEINRNGVAFDKDSEYRIMGISDESPDADLRRSTTHPAMLVDGTTYIPVGMVLRLKNYYIARKYDDRVYLDLLKGLEIRLYGADGKYDALVSAPIDVNGANKYAPESYFAENERVVIGKAADFQDEKFGYTQINGYYFPTNTVKRIVTGDGGKVKAVIASGLNVPAIKLAAEKTGYSPVYVNDGPMIDMLKQAEELAQSGDAVLLSPAAASWGIYDNYEQRGEIFKELVNKL